MTNINHEAAQENLETKFKCTGKLCMNRSVNHEHSLMTGSVHILGAGVLLQVSQLQVDNSSSEAYVPGAEMIHPHVAKQFIQARFREERENRQAPLLILNDGGILESK